MVKALLIEDDKDIRDIITTYFRKREIEIVDELVQNLVNAGYIRREIAQRLNLRMTPEFTFYEDHSIEHGAKISKLLNGIEITPEEDEEEND